MKGKKKKKKCWSLASFYGGVKAASGVFVLPASPCGELTYTRGPAASRPSCRGARWGCKQGSVMANPGLKWPLSLYELCVWSVTQRRISNPRMGGLTHCLNTGVFKKKKKKKKKKKTQKTHNHLSIKHTFNLSARLLHQIVKSRLSPVRP